MSEIAVVTHKFVQGFYSLEEAIKDGWRIYSIHELAEGGYEFDVYRPT